MNIVINKSTRALIFDLDGTLVDSMSAHFSAWQKIGDKYGFSFSRDMCYKYAGTPTYHVVLILNKIFNLYLDPVTVSEEQESFFLDELYTVRLIEPVFDVVKKYKDKLPMAIGTGSPGKLACTIMKATKIDTLFDVIVTCDDVPKHKPEPDIFLECARRMNVEPLYCQVFEDGDLGIKAAKKAGMKVTDVRDYIKNKL